MPVHQYRALRKHYWTDDDGMPRLYDQGKGDDGDIYYIDTDLQGAPMHHMQSLDGGPVQDKPEGSPYGDEIPVGVATEDPATLFERSRTESPGPLGLPKRKSGKGKRAAVGQPSTASKSTGPKQSGGRLRPEDRP